METLVIMIVNLESQIALVNWKSHYLVYIKTKVKVQLPLRRSIKYCFDRQEINKFKMKIKVKEIKKISENLLGFITVYVMWVGRNESTPAYRIYRRYHEIHGLHEHLKQIFHTSFTGVRFPPFPTRQLLFLSDRSAQRKLYVVKQKI